MIERIEILGVPVDCLSMGSVLEQISSILEQEKCRTIFAVNPEKVIRCREDKVLFDAITQSDILIPDGIGVVLAARLLYGKKLGRVAGADLMPKICELCVEKGKSVFLFGAKPETNTALVDVLKSRFPELRVAGNQDGYIKDDENEQLIDHINDSGADVLFIALGSPKQEKWARENAEKLNVKIIQGVGGTFDVLTGNVRRAPVLFQKLNLEWFYRLVSQPKRLIRQTALPKFFFKVLKEKIVS
jgi:N-acetylglucosaminyldiphosphoundecaprenol N-acetyl-beta-D-mannosaminyltransferase